MRAHRPAVRPAAYGTRQFERERGAAALALALREHAPAVRAAIDRTM